MEIHFPLSIEQHVLIYFPFLRPFQSFVFPQEHAFLESGKHLRGFSVLMSPANA